MQTRRQITRRSAEWAIFIGVSSSLAQSACVSDLPSARIKSEVYIPIPRSAMAPPTKDRLLEEDRGERYVLSPRTLIPIAFEQQPDIKSSFQRFKSEEARYDFFYSSRDSLTPNLSTSNSASDARTKELVTRNREHAVEFSVEKRFFDTTELNVAAGYRTKERENDIGNAPFLSASLRYPFSASREKLARTSEDIFRRNELDDVQLAYIQEIRTRLQSVLFSFHEVVDLRRQVGYYEDWIRDLESLADRVVANQGNPPSPDHRRLDAELTRVRADLRNTRGLFEVESTRFKAACGIPFHARIELVDEPFNPFKGKTHQELLRLGIETDPDIATLQNSVRNAEVQLDLARRGTWDVALLLNTESDLEGRGTDDGVSDWSLAVGLDISAVDGRVTTSLSRQAQANIGRFRQAIAARENAIFADTFEPLIRIETLGKSRHELINNLP